jgi:hypothetical protein
MGKFCFSNAHCPSTQSSAKLLMSGIGTHKNALSVKVRSKKEMLWRAQMRMNALNNWNSASVC